MIIRQLDLSDVDQIAKLHIDTESQSYKNVAPEMLNYVSDFEGRKQIWRKSLELGTIAYFGFVDKTSYPIAFVSGRAVYDVSTSSDYALLSGVFVTREHQSRGIGKSLLLRFVQMQIQNNVNEMRSRVSIQNTSGRDFFASLGANENRIYQEQDRFHDRVYGQN